jgi:hypothetical protein
MSPTLFWAMDEVKVSWDDTTCKTYSQVMSLEKLPQ